MIRVLIVLPIALGLASVVHAQDRLSEDEAVRLGLDRAAFRELLDSRQERAAGQLEAAGRWDNPEIEFSLEDVGGPGGGSEEQSFWLRQRFNLAGVHGLERQSAAERSAAQSVQSELSRREQEAGTRRLFHDVLAAERELEAVERWQRRLAELVTDAEARERAGDASRFDALRLRHELAVLQGERLALEASLDSARARLFGLLDIEPVPLTGRLLPEPILLSDISSLIASHPAILALDAEIRAAELAGEAAERQRWPELVLGLGRRKLDEPGLSVNGNLFMVGLDLPLFDRRRGTARAERADAREKRAERELVASRLSAELETRLLALTAQRSAAQTLLELQENESLTDIAEAAYRLGEIGVLELIDAHRTELAASRLVIRREREARESMIEIQFLRGEP